MSKGMIMLQPVLQYLDNTGKVLAGGKLYFYEPSSTTPQNTYTDQTKSVANANPVLLDSAGRPTSAGTPINIYLDGQYKLVVTDSAGNMIREIDPFNTLGQLVSTEQVNANINVTEDNRDQFLVVDASAASITLTVDSAATLGSGFQFAVKKIDSSTNTVTIQFHGSETGDGQNTIVLNTQYQNQAFTSDGTQWLVNSIVAPNLTVGHIVATTANIGNLEITGNTLESTNTNGNINLTPNGTGQTFVNGALNLTAGTLASASSMAVGAANNDVINVTGTTTITAFDTIQAGVTRKLVFAGILTITYNATTMVLPGGGNIVTAAGDVATFRSLGSGNWTCDSYTTAEALQRLLYINRQTFTAGIGTYTPTTGMVQCDIEAISGGGGGGGFLGAGSFTGAAGGGGAGAYLKISMSATNIGSSQSLVIGSGGAGGVAGNNVGQTGGTTSVGALFSLTGGAGGNGCTVVSNSQSISGGSGGSASVTTGTVILGIGGNSGSSGVTLNGTYLSISGAGGSNPVGFGGIPTISGAGSVGSGFGAGGAGAAGSSSSAAGGPGTNGFIIITEYIAL